MILYTVSQKNCANLFFAPCLLNMNRFVLEGLFQNKHLTKLYLKCPLHLKYVLALPWEKVSDWAVDTIIIGVHLNDWLNSNKHDWQQWFIVSQKVTSITSHHLYYSMWSKCPPPARTQPRRPWCNSTTAHSVIVRLRAAHSLLMSRFSSLTSEILVQ